MIRSMKTSIEKSPDFRQSAAWGKYMQKIGWKVETLDGVQIFIRPFPFGTSYIKIQHPILLPDLKKLDALAQKHHALAVVIEPHTYQYDTAILKNAGYRISALHHAPTATRKIDISPPLQSIVETFSENAKRNIKKALKKRIIVKSILAKDDTRNTYFQKYFLLQKHLTEMKKFYAPGREESIKKNHELKDASFFAFAYDGSSPIATKDPIASVWYGFDKGVVTYLQTGITKRGYEVLANYLLVLEGIKMGKKLHCTVMDFESIYDPRYPKEAVKWKGYSEFKSRFHGEAIYYPPSWIKIYNPFFKWFYQLSSPFI